ncbi:MAG TPA: phytanoyl-CoA dioxygenase family protein [Gammaproteobacteria bacterium]|nr:phytanoyl-CoA dioxygenase family protein [Gammaproteobacteria bacterium]
MNQKARSFNRSQHSFINEPQKALENYISLGYHIEHDIFSDQECDTLVNTAYELEDAKNQIFRPNMMPHKQHDIFLKAMKKPFIVKTIATLVGGNAIGLQSEFFYSKPGTRGFSLHQDNFYVEATYGVFASAWIALTDVYPEKGGLIIYPGSHKTGKLPVRKLNFATDISQDPNANNEEVMVPPQCTRCDITISKGAILFIHGHLVHGSNTNITNEWRYVLLCTYIKEGEDFRSGRYAKREEVQLI